jgi:UDP-N-acetylmuramate--alanine ligase
MEQKQVHFIGIGGTGLSAIARVLLERGFTVTGSDRAMSPMAKSLQADGVRVEIGHRAENVAGAQMVVRSSAVPDDNVEVVAARRRGIPVLKRNEFLGSLLEGYFVIAVAGTHGKTTTTAMIAWMLTHLGQDPSYIVGGILDNTGKNAHAGNGQAFVIEADEYDRMFLGLSPSLAVITNIEHDHPDCYPTEADYFTAFVEFASHVGNDGTLLTCFNDRNAQRLAEIASQRGQKVCSYSVLEAQDKPSDLGVDYAAYDLQSNQLGGMSWNLDGYSQDLQLTEKVELQVPGRHNVQNSLAAMAVAHQMKLPLEKASLALSEYSGTGRRFEVRTELNGIAIIDDYAHHPTEIKATISAARSRYPDRQVWVVWQPHTYSRTRLLFDLFMQAFDQADHLIITDIFAAREMPPDDGFSSKQLVKAMKHPDVQYMVDYAKISRNLVERVQPGAVLLVLSAGDADQISAEVEDLLEEGSENNE